MLGTAFGLGAAGSAFAGTSIELPTAVGFSAYRTSAAGSANAVIGGYTEVWDSDSAFNTSTGTYTVPSTGTYLIIGAGYPTGGIGNLVLWSLRLQLNGSNIVEQFDNANFGWHGSSNSLFVTRNLTASQTIRLFQGGDTAENVVFCALKLDSVATVSSAFGGYRATEAGSVGGTITGFTEHTDVGSDFNGSTGVYTAPATDHYFIGAHGDGEATGSTQLIPQVDGTSISNITCPTNLDPAYWDQNPHGHLMLVPLTSGEDLTYVQSGDTFNRVSFSGFQVPADHTSLASAYKSSWSTNNSTVTSWTGTRVNQGSAFNTTSGKYVAPYTGKYLLSAFAKTRQNTGETQVRIYAEGSELCRGRSYHAVYWYDRTSSIATLRSLTAGDEVTVQTIGTVTDLNFSAWCFGA